jgi:outer membrane protein assembly factor BamB
LKQFVVLDNQGLTRYDATWTLDNPSLATISTDSLPTLTALAAGTVTLTATVQGVSAQMPVAISGLSAFPTGTILWSAPAVSGFSPQQIVQAAPTDFGPDVFAIQGNGGTQTLIQAFTADGQEMWQTTLPQPTVSNAPDGMGGIIATEACSASNPSGVPMTLVDLDAVTGTTLWQAPITSTQNACPPGPPSTAIRQDGSVVVAAPLQTSPALFFVGSTSGNAPAIPPSTITDEFGNVGTCDCYTPVGPPMVDSDNSVYLEYEVRQLNLSSPQISSILSLMKIAPDGSTTDTQLSSSDSANLFPGAIIPDGQGGVLATWTIVPTDPNAPPLAFPYQGADVGSGGGANTFNLPLPPSGKPPIGANGLPINPALVLGENGLAFVSYGSSIVCFNLNNGSAIWSYPVTSPTSLTLISYGGGEGLVAKSTTGSVDTVLHFDMSGNVTSDGWTASSLDYFLGNSWFGSQSGVLALGDYFAEQVDATPSLFPAPKQKGLSRAYPILVMVHFTQDMKNPNDSLSPLNASGGSDCSEELGWTDCSSWPEQPSWRWNLEGQGNTFDSATNWSVVQSVQFKYKGFYRDGGNNLQSFVCQGTVSPDGPNPPLALQKLQNTIFWIDGPGLPIVYNGANPPGYEDAPPFCNVQLSTARPIDQMTLVYNFSVNYGDSALGFSRSVRHYVLLHVSPGSIFNRSLSKAAYGKLPLNF